jgi:F-type H+-transporting ATPase subunit delta
MPLIDSPPDNVARIYARSLIEMVNAAGGRPAVEATQSELEEILQIARENPRFGEFLASRVVPEASRAASIEKIFAGRISETTRKFLQVLNMKGRLAHLPAISAAFDSMVQTLFGRVEVDVFTAQALAPDAFTSMRERLSTAISREVVLYSYTDASMIGGVRFRIGDQLIDASISTRLRQMRDQVERDGAARIRGAISKMIDDTAR